jgi:hypothetical protein
VSCGRAAALLVALAGALWVVPAQGQLSILEKELKRSPGSRIKVESVFDKLPPSGYAPIRVTATNGGNSPEQWRFEFTSATNVGSQDHRASSSFALPLPAQSTRSAVFLVPQCVSYGNVGYRGSDRLELRCISRSQGVHSDNAYESRADGFPAIAMSKPLAAATLSKLEDELETKMSGASRYGGSQRVFAARFDPVQLPEEWLGLSGFDYLLLRPADWERLTGAQRRAILHWVRLGGALHLYKVGKPDLKDLGMPGIKGARSRLSQGELAMFQWSGKDLPSKEVVNRYWGKKDRLRVLREDYANPGGWGLANAFGTRSFAAWQVLVFLAIFGVLVGPVNLFVLAPPGKRHKLFFTTPILSVGASLVMVGLILIQDGTGGEGRRLAVVELRPDEAVGLVTQEQICRTGVLTSSAFELPQPMLMQSLALPESSWVMLTNSSDSQSSRFQLNGLEISGSLFQSRAEQAHALQAVVSTRARVELKPSTQAGAKPVLVSALGFPVEQLFYVDSEGKVWKSNARVEVGSDAVLTASSIQELRDWWKAERELAGHSGKRHALAKAVDSRDVFFATGAAAPGFLQETLPSIRWDDDRVIVFGPIHQP